MLSGTLTQIGLLKIILLDSAIFISQPNLTAGLILDGAKWEMWIFYILLVTFEVVNYHETLHSSF